MLKSQMNFYLLQLIAFEDYSLIFKINF